MAVVKICRRCGSTVELRNGAILPNGWTSDGYCPRCAAKIADERDYEEKKRRKAEKAYWNSPKGKKEQGAATKAYAIGIIIAVIVYFITGSGFLAIASFCIGGTIPFFLFGYTGQGCGCSALSVVVMGIAMMFCAPPSLKGCSNDSPHNPNNNKPQTAVVKDVPKETPKPKLPSYLQNIDDIKYSGPLSTFYFNIASGFYNDDMGLKGTPEQIKAGNKIMLEVYEFLGTSARAKLKKTQADMNVDSMKMVIKKFSGVSDFRKKKALEELQFGVDKIKSVK